MLSICETTNRNQLSHTDFTPVCVFVAMESNLVHLLFSHFEVIAILYFYCTTIQKEILYVLLLHLFDNDLIVCPNPSKRLKDSSQHLLSDVKVQRADVQPHRS